MLRVATESEVRERVGRWRDGGKTVALVPTMGALHPGHLELAATAKKKADRVIVSIFVNPTQFGPTEDFARYPRQPEEDLALLAAHGIDAAWMPQKHDIYPEGFATKVTAGSLGETLCGASRPSHFNGVATVVSVLLQIVRPDISVFGMKDFQQLAIIRRVHADLRLSGAILGHPIVREADGLAMSSRNRYLSAEERASAPQLYAQLERLRKELKRGESWNMLQTASKDILQQAGFRPDYVDYRNENDLTELFDYHRAGRLFIAAWLGKTRLIDNLGME